jgi:hypothetical protein
MKTHALIAMVILGLSTGANAEKCNYAANEVDPFTGIKTLQTKWDQLTSTWMADSREIDGWISVRAVDGKAALWVKLDYSIKTTKEPAYGSLRDAIVIQEGAPLLILMADDSIIELTATHEVRKDAYSVAPWEQSANTDKFVVRAVASIEYALPAEAITALKAQHATDIRITAANRNYDVEIHKKSLTDFHNAFACTEL